jgi:hypothetical protein
MIVPIFVKTLEGTVISLECENATESVQQELFKLDKEAFPILYTIVKPLEIDDKDSVWYIVFVLNKKVQIIRKRGSIFEFSTKVDVDKDREYSVTILIDLNDRYSKSEVTDFRSLWNYYGVVIKLFCKTYEADNFIDSFEFMTNMDENGNYTENRQKALRASIPDDIKNELKILVKGL